MLNSRIGQRWIFRSNSGWLGGDKITDATVLTVCSGFLIMGLLMLAQVSIDALRSDASSEWPTAIGTIVAVQVDELEVGNDIHWFPRVSYEYHVHGRTMMDTRLTPGQQPHWRDRNEAIRFLERYVARAEVVVYYNPDNMAEAVLEPRHGGRMQPMLGLGLAMFAIGFCGFVFYGWLR